MKARIRIIAEHAPTIVFAIGLAVLCLSVAQWSTAAAGVIAGGVLMAIGGAPAYLVFSRRGARKDS